MNTADRRRLLAYIGQVRTALRMDNWDVVLHSGYVDEEDAVHAETWQHENHTVLNIRVAQNLLDLEPGGIRNTIVHELTHAQHRDVSRLWTEACAQVPRPVETAWNGEFVVHMERFVSWVADRIEDSVPMWDPKAPAPRHLDRGLFLHIRPS